MMNNVNLIYIILLLLTVVVAIYSIIIGKNSPKNSLTRNFILALVLSIIVSTLLIDQYYTKQLDLEKQKLDKLYSTSQLNDSVLPDSVLRQQKLESLEKQNQDLQKILENIKYKEKVLGQQDIIKSNIYDKIETNKTEIGVITKYNEILDKKAIEKWKGYSSTGTTSNFIFICPTDFKSDSIELKLKFKDEIIISQIQFLFISFSERINEKESTALFDQIYQPQQGVNGFKVKNYFKLKKKIELEIGYILKTESKKDYPNFERVVCKNY